MNVRKTEHMGNPNNSKEIKVEHHLKINSLFHQQYLHKLSVVVTLCSIQAPLFTSTITKLMQPDVTNIKNINCNWLVKG